MKLNCAKWKSSEGEKICICKSAALVAPRQSEYLGENSEVLSGAGRNWIEWMINVSIKFHCIILIVTFLL